MLISLGVFTLLYGVLAVIEVRLLTKYAKAGPDTDEKPPAKDPKLRLPSGGPGSPDGGTAAEDEDADKPLTFAY